MRKLRLIRVGDLLECPNRQVHEEEIRASPSVWTALEPRSVKWALPGDGRAARQGRRERGEGERSSAGSSSPWQPRGPGPGGGRLVLITRRGGRGGGKAPALRGDHWPPPGPTRGAAPAPAAALGDGPAGAARGSSLLSLSPVSVSARLSRTPSLCLYHRLPSSLRR